MKMKMKDGIDPDEIAFRVNYKPKVSKYIRVNGHLLSRPHFTSEISNFFAYIHSNPNRTITRIEVEKALKIELQKGMDDILRDLGFRGVVAKIFFKKMTNRSVFFTNPVTHRDLMKLGIDIMDVYKTAFSPKRKKALGPTN